MPQHAKKTTTETARESAGSTYYNRFSNAPETDAAGVVRGYTPLPPFFFPAAALCAAVFAALAIFG